MQGQDGDLSTATTATVSSGITGGATYLFRVRARNIHDWSVESSELSVVASGAPSTPAAPATTLESLDVRISWSAPTTNHASITAYKLAIENSASSFIEENTYCDGSDPAIIANL